MSDIVQKIKDGEPQPHEGYAILQSQPAGWDSKLRLLPTVNKGYSISELNSLYGNRLNRPRYYTSTPSGLPY